MSYLAEDVDKEDQDIPVWREMEISSTEQPAKTSFSIPFGLYQFNQERMIKREEEERVTSIQFCTYGRNISCVL